MSSHDIKPESLFNVLKKRGWIWDSDRLCAPKNTFWIEGTEGHNTPCGMLLNMRERITVALTNLRANQLAHLSTEQHQDLVSDMESLLNAIEELLENQIRQ